MRARHLEIYGDEDTVVSDEEDEIADRVLTIRANPTSPLLELWTEVERDGILVCNRGGLYFDTFYSATASSIEYDVPVDSLIYRPSRYYCARRES